MVFFTSCAPECCFAPQRPGLGAGKRRFIAAPLSGASIGKSPKEIWLTKRLPLETICKQSVGLTRFQKPDFRYMILKSCEFLCRLRRRSKAIQAVTPERAAWLFFY
ncbi:hypothetical protein [Novosphingobium sp.]|uniref:hypothetical protein n=1 Tax=Novosphingobium sp. TaxID=1874826 RepID=UPI00260F3CFE|nr:hypothetical protein [Novosphingobium sp.]